MHIKYMRTLRLQGVKNMCKFTQLVSVGPGTGMISTQCSTRWSRNLRAHQGQPLSQWLFLILQITAYPSPPQRGVWAAEPTVCFIPLHLYIQTIFLSFLENYHNDHNLIFISSFKIPRTSLAVQWLRLRLPMHGVRVWSLVGELGSHMPRSQKTKT